MLWERDLMSWERDKYFFHMSPQCCRGGGGVRKMNIFLVRKFGGFFLGHHKTGLYLGVISMHFSLYMVFS